MTYLRPPVTTKLLLEILEADKENPLKQNNLPETVRSFHELSLSLSSSRRDPDGFTICYSYHTDLWSQKGLNQSEGDPHSFYVRKGSTTHKELVDDIVKVVLKNHDEAVASHEKEAETLRIAIGKHILEDLGNVKRYAYKHHIDLDFQRLMSAGGSRSSISTFLFAVVSALLHYYPEIESLFPLPSEETFLQECPYSSLKCLDSVIEQDPS